MIIPADRLTRLTATILQRAGAPADMAQTCAEHLVEANLKGHDSHGVGMAPSYVRWIAAGKLFPDRSVKVIHDHVAVLVVDGQFGLGQVVARQAVDLAIERARRTGVACLALRNACHIGRIGSYGEQCAEAGMVSMHYVNVIGEPAVAPFGGAEPRMLTNPYCCTLPRPDGEHIVLDFATSAVAIGKLRVAFMKGETVAPGVLMDAEGRPTQDPRAIFSGGGPRGFLLPFGLHKGGGLQILCELLGGALAGQWTVQPDAERYGAAVNNMLSIVIDPDALGGREAFEAEADAMLDFIRGTRPSEGVAAVLAPGDPERAAKAQRLAAGVPIDDNSWRDIVNAAESVGVAQAEIASIASSEG
jgi:uncharacterized oxidoreductase